MPVAPLSEVPDDAARGCATGRPAASTWASGLAQDARVFEPDGLPNCYDAIVLPSLMLDVFTSASDEAAMRRAQQAEAITARWLAPGGMQLPARATVEEVVVQLDAYDLYHASLPHPALHLSGVEGALRARRAMHGRGGRRARADHRRAWRHRLPWPPLRPRGRRRGGWHVPPAEGARR